MAQCCPKKHTQLPELQQGHASPDTAHVREPGHASRQDQPAAVCTIHSSAHQDSMQQQESDVEQEPTLQAEPTFSYRQEQSLSSAASCLRCGVKQSQKMLECRFHPALLADPGPLLYSPEWHACRADKHGRGDPGCYVRQGHYFPGHAVQNTGLVTTKAERGQSSSPLSKIMQPQPRTQLPVPMRRPV